MKQLPKEVLKCAEAFRHEVTLSSINNLYELFISKKSAFIFSKGKQFSGLGD